MLSVKYITILIYEAPYILSLNKLPRFYIYIVENNNFGK